MTVDGKPEEIGDDDLDQVQGAGAKATAQTRSSKGSGSVSVYPDVCKTPAPPAPFAATPFPDAVDSFDTVGEKTAKSSMPTKRSTLNREI